MNITGYSDIKKLSESRDRVIYTGLRESDHKPVVLKTLRSEHPSADMIALMYHEYEVSKDLDLPGVLQTYALIDQQNHYALVQEDMQGISLQEYLQKKPLNDLALFFKLANQMVQIVGELHQHHIIHKDIKPSNFIIHPETLTLKLTDFNYSSKLLHEAQDIVPPNKLEGTLAYMAPEQTGRMNMNLDYRSDYYSLGVTFYEMLTGELPFVFDDPLELLHAHLANPIPQATSEQLSIPSMLIKIVEKLMMKNPRERYQSTIGLQADLERCQKALEKSGKIMAFTLGEDDIFDRLNLSQKLYGREEEASALLNAYDRVSKGGVETLMVCGYSGIGKTMLINEVHKPMVKQKGYFISGKFDQLQRDTPYTAITQAFNQLARLVLSEPEERFAIIKRDIIDALGSVAQVVLDLAPDLERVIGAQPRLEKLPPEETQNRMMIYCRRFLRAIVSEDRPLVLFIDDLQWIDSGSLQLLEYFMTDDELTNVLLIGSYRDNEVGEEHPLRKLLEVLQSQHSRLETLSLAPLTNQDFTSLFKDSFNREEAAIKPFAELIHKRTNGNPFFCKQVINTLYTEKLLCFDYTKRQWDWKLADITSLKITDNLIDLMLGKLQELPSKTQALLKYAACVGNRFKVETIILISGLSANEIGKALWPALEHELILTLQLGYKRMDAIGHGDLGAILSQQITYQFAHDRVQQAVYEGISDQEKQEIHLSIARLMMEKEPEACRKVRLFEVTDHYNLAQDLLTDIEKLQVVKLNHQAGDRARNSSAYRPMSNYLHSALNLMDDLWWDNHYELCLDVNRDYAFSLIMLNDIDQAETLIESALTRAKNKVDKVNLLRILILSYVSQSKITDIVKTAQTASGLLGVYFPTHPSQTQVLIKYLKIQKMMRPFQLAELDKELPPLSDPAIEAVFDLLTEMVGHWGCQSLVYYSYGLFLGFELLLRYGKPANAGYWIYGYAAAKLYTFDSITDLPLCMEVSDRFYRDNVDKYSSSRTMLDAAGFYHLHGSVAEGVKYIERGIQEASESGNLFYKMWGSYLLIEYTVIESKSLEKIVKRTKAALKISEIPDFSECIEVDLHLYESLFRGDDLPLARIEELDQVLNNSEHWVAIWSARSRTSYYYFMEQYEQAIENYHVWYSGEKFLRFYTSDLNAKTALGLTLAKSIPSATGRTRLHYQRRFLKVTSQLKRMSKQSPENYLHQYLLLKAVKKKLKGHDKEALSWFIQAAEHAKEGDFYLWVAQANELAGEMLVEQGQPRSSVDYIREAHYYYDRYGMAVKVRALEKRYPDCFAERIETKTGAAAEGAPSLHGATLATATSQGLDFMSIIKASQTISGEIVLDKLFEKMLHIVVENAGAQRAVFIERHEKVWNVIASLDAHQGQEVFTLLHTSLKECREVPLTIIQYALRSGEPVVLNHAAEDSQYRKDPYIMQEQPKSILCLPVLYHDKILGAIYLENNLTVGAFTQDRVTVLTTLSSQIAISLENARHFEVMEKLYRSTERFVPRQFLEILHRKTIEEIQLGDCLRINISVLFADIRKFTTILEKLEPEEAFAFVNRYWAVTAPVIRKYRGFINQYQGDGILALFPVSADDAVAAGKGMLNVLQDFNQEQRKLGAPELEIGVGINSGPAMLGIIGEKERLEPAVVSDIANTASRVETLNKTYGTHFLLSGSSFASLKHSEEYQSRTIDKVRLKGKSVTTYLHEIIDWEQQLQGISLAEYLELYSHAFSAYENGDFGAAKETLERCLKHRIDDLVVETLRQRCEEFAQQGVPEGWDGVYTMTHK